MTVAPIPEGFRAVTPHLVIDGAEKALEFYQRAFGAEVLGKHPMPDGSKLMHALMKIGDSLIMLADAFPDWGSFGPDPSRSSPVILHLYVEDTDAAFQRAVDAGATATMPPADMFWGDRYATVTCPFGHRWSFATHIEDVPPDQLEERAKKALG